MASRSSPPPPPDFGEDETTVVEGDIITPVEPPLCRECGTIATIDSFLMPPHFPDDQCVQSPDGHFHSCAKLKKAVFYWGKTV